MNLLEPTGRWYESMSLNDHRIPLAVELFSAFFSLYSLGMMSRAFNQRVSERGGICGFRIITKLPTITPVFSSQILDLTLPGFW